MNTDTDTDTNADTDKDTDTNKDTDMDMCNKCCLNIPNYIKCVVQCLRI